jgi:subtilisin family serine protease
LRVAVIDSGVNPGHPHIVSVAGGVSIAADGTIDRGSYLDRLGHGTAVMAAIQEKAPGAEYYAVKIFHDALRTSSKSLVAAMEWAVDMGVDVINLSLGTKNPAHAALFGPVAERAGAKGCVVVSAYDCYPGCLPGVIGVNLDPDCDRNTYYVRDATYFAAGYPRSAPGIPRERNLQGISFAVANISGFIAGGVISPLSRDTSSGP